MPNVSSALFVAKVLDRALVENKQVLDVGACDYNGSVGPLIKSWKPAKYIGVDLEPGPGVDIVCPAENLLEKFGGDCFDIVICIEMLEHAKEWRQSVNNMKKVLKPGGLMVLTTRSFGYPCHGFPHDFWRYELQDIENIFSDFEIITLEKDYLEPGVFLLAKQIPRHAPADLSLCELYSVPLNKRVSELPSDYEVAPYYRKLKFKQSTKKFASQAFLGSGKLLTKILGLR